MSQADIPRVFLSYSWDDDQHRDRVLALAHRLRQDGINAWVDRFTQFASQGWDAWMRDEIARASFVLCVITKNYADRFLGRTPPGVGRGVKWEGAIVTDAIYGADGNNTKFIPIFFDKEDAALTPFPLKRHVDLRYVLPEGYNSIYRLLTGQHDVVPTVIGTIREMPPIPAPDPLSQPKVYRHRRNLGNLPRLPYFFGREDQLKIIDDALQPAARTWIVLIDGPGGVGKTTLAIRAAELASEEDYPRIVFASAKVRELGPDGVRAVRDFLIDSYLDLLNSVARELGDDTLAKLEEKERPEALLRLLRDRPALLLLDNLESLPKDDLDRLLEFLKHLPPGVKAIITSRRRTDIQAEIIRLDKMQWQAAAELLAELARHYPLLQKASDEERRELYQKTGGNPLILGWVAGQLGLGRGRCRTVEGALGLLRESPAGDEALEFVFGDLVDTFTVEETKLLAALTYFTQPVEVKHISELAELSPIVAQSELESLSDRSLVIGDAELRYFFLTPLVADFLRRKKPEVVRESGDRLANTVYVLTVENGFHRYSHFPVLEEAWPMVEAGLPVLDYDKLQTVCDALADFLDCACRWDESIALNRLTEDKAVSQRDFWKAGLRACGEASVMFLRGNAEGVHAAVDRAAAHWQHITPSHFGLGILSRRRGMGYELQEDFPAALAAYRETLQLWRVGSPESQDVARVLSDIAGIERHMRDYDAAERNYQEALRIAQKTGFVLGVTKYAGNLADLALDRKQWSEAEAVARKALVLAKRVRHRELIAANYLRIATALAHQDQPVEGMPFARRALDIFTALRAPELASAEETLRELEEKLRHLGIEYMGQEWLEEEEQALLADLEYGDRLTEGRALYELGLMLQGHGRHKDAEVKFQEALDIWRESRKTIEEARTLNSLGWTYQKQKRWANAEECYREALAICEEINDEGEQWRSRENIERLKEEQALSSAGDRTSASAQTQTEQTPGQTLFEAEVQGYEQEDALSPPAQGVLLFYGSSSIRLWPSLKDDFPGYPVLNRGFGGATMRDCVRLYPRLVKPYAPRVIILYGGDNDLADGHSPRHILDSLKEFLDLLAKDFPSTLVAFISIKPSPVRQALDEIEETNRLIETYASERDNLTFIDIYHKMLKPNLSPNEELFLDDQLHMNQAGYDVWKEAAEPYLSAVWPHPANPA